MKKYVVFHKADKIGTTYASSEKKAISNARFNSNRRYAPMCEFSAREVNAWDRD